MLAWLGIVGRCQASGKNKVGEQGNGRSSRRSGVLLVTDRESNSVDCLFG